MHIRVRQQNQCKCPELLLNVNLPEKFPQHLAINFCFSTIQKYRYCTWINEETAMSDRPTMLSKFFRFTVCADFCWHMMLRSLFPALTCRK